MSRLRLSLPRTSRIYPLALVALVATTPALAQRSNLALGESNWRPQPPGLTDGLSATTTDLNTLTPQDLVDELLGAGVTSSNITFNGAPISGGIFTGGTGIFGFERGIVLSTGDVGTIAGPLNTLAGASTITGFPGDPDLEALAGVGTNDAAILEFDFECPQSTTASFQFVFASEEYNEYVFQFNDAFGLFVNGVNIALVPGTMDAVTINNVNCGNPYAAPAGGVNCSRYVNNDCFDIPPGTYPCAAVNTEMDGMTQVFSAVATLNPGVNHIKLAVADALDTVWDSNILIRGNSLVCSAPAPVFDPPSPCGQTLSATVGSPFDFTAVALATNGLSGQTVSIDATGSQAALMGGTFTPSLPTTPAPTVTTQFNWTPTPADVGLHTIVLTATDQLGQVTECTVGILVEPLGSVSQPICDPNAINSTGNPGRMWAVGSAVVTDNNLTLLLVDAPMNSFTFAVVSQDTNIVMNPGGSMGNICIASFNIGRYDMSTQNTGALGQASLAIDLTSVPQQPAGPQVIMPGETWNWQWWYRDLVGGVSTSNWSNAVSVLFQ